MFWEEKKKMLITCSEDKSVKMCQFPVYWPGEMIRDAHKTYGNNNNSQQRNDDMQQQCEYDNHFVFNNNNNDNNVNSSVSHSNVNKKEMYSNEELKTIISRSAKILGINMSEDSAMELAKRSRGTPRIANRLLKRVRDFAEVKGKGNVDIELAKTTLNALEIDDLGLDYTDRKVLTTLIEKFHGGPCGLETLAAATGEDRHTIEDVYEPYLMQIGFLTRTARGRCVTKLAYDHLGIENNTTNQQSMF
jgi:hypothetical protein